MERLWRPSPSLCICAAGLATALVYSNSALAKFYDMYRADYAKGAFCAAIAGACASDNNPENSFFQNPASLESAESDLIYDADYNPSDNLEPGTKVSSNASDTTFMGGIAWAGQSWGYGLSFSGRFSDVKADATLYDDQNVARPLKTTDSSLTLTLNLPVAWRVNKDFSIGASMYALYYRESLDVQGSPKSNTTPIDKFPQIGFSVGAIYSDSGALYRLGTWARSGTTYYVNQQINVQQFSNNFLITEDMGLHYPLIWATGASLMPWKDQRTFLLDLDVISTTSDGYERTLDTFTSQANNSATSIRRKGRRLSLEPHLAWRAPWWKTSKGTYTLGSYYESGRWEGIAGRAHGVASLAYNLPFMEMIIAIDGARDFFGVQVSFR